MLARGASAYMVLPALGLAVALGMDAAGQALAAGWLGWSSFAIGALVAFQFRDPRRTIAEGVVSPVDGKVSVVEETDQGTLVDVFLRPFDVHAARAPVAGRVVRTEYRRGGHRPAYEPASVDNERLTFVIESAAGQVSVALIAGILWRRIIPYVTAGARVEAGQRLAFITFGSRCQLRLPVGTEVQVSAKDRVWGGRTRVAEALAV